MVKYSIGDRVIIKDEVIQRSDSCRLKKLLSKEGVVKEIYPNGYVKVCFPTVPIRPNCLRIRADKVVHAENYADYQAERMEANMERMNRAYWDYREEYGHW